MGAGSSSGYAMHKGAGSPSGYAMHKGAGSLSGYAMHKSNCYAYIQCHCGHFKSVILNLTS